MPTLPSDDAHTGDDDTAGKDDRSVPPLDAALLPEVVAELASDAERIDRHLDTLRDDLDLINSVLGEQSNQLRILDNTFRVLEESLAETVDLTRPSRWAWPFLTRDEARELWQETRWFVDYIVASYALPTDIAIPPCWYRHEDARDELADLYAAWREAYCGSDRPSSVMIAWRDRWFWPALQRLATYVDWRECKQARHHVEPAVRKDSTDSGFEEYVDAELAQRPEKRSKDLPWPARKPVSPGRPPGARAPSV